MESRPSYIKKFMRSKTLSESSETSLGAESLPEMETTEIQQFRQRAGSVNAREEAVAAGNAPAEPRMENFLYDKYLANFFNPLHTKPTGEGIAPEAKSKGILYDVDGKFAYSTYSAEMRSYHPMLDIKTLTKDLK